jgi:dihydroorotate dehydrogenase
MYYYITDSRAAIHRWIVVPGLRFFYEDAEEAHHIANQSLKMLHQFGLHPRERGNADAAGDLQVEVLSSFLRS